MNVARTFFEGRIYKAIKESPKRAQEEEHQMLATTQCIRMRFPKQGQQDALVRLDIGFDSDLIETLFPRAWKRFLSVHGTGSKKQPIKLDIRESDSLVRK